MDSLETAFLVLVWLGAALVFAIVAIYVIGGLVGVALMIREALRDERER